MLKRRRARHFGRRAEVFWTPAENRWASLLSTVDLFHYGLGGLSQATSGAIADDAMKPLPRLPGTARGRVTIEQHPDLYPAFWRAFTAGVLAGPCETSGTVACRGSPRPRAAPRAPRVAVLAGMRPARTAV